MIISDLQFLVLRKSILKRPLKVKIITGSMKPLIRINETIEVSNIGESELKTYDVVVYHAEDQKLICHFIWGKSTLNPGKYLLGSLNGGNRLDFPVPKDKILGVVTNKKITFWYKLILFLRKVFS